MTSDDYLNAAIVIKANKCREPELTEEVITKIKETLERRCLHLDDEQIKSGWECLSPI
jgi:hypothetical protein